LRLPEFPDERRMKVGYLVPIYVRGWIDHRATVRPEGLSPWEIPISSSGIETATFPARSAVYQSTAPPRVEYLGMLLCRTSVWGKGALVFRGTDNTRFSCYSSTLMAWLVRLVFLCSFPLPKFTPLQASFAWKISSTPPPPPLPPLPPSTKYLRPQNMCWFPWVCTYFREHKYCAIFWSA